MNILVQPSPTYDSLISRALLEVNDDISRLKSSPTYLKYQASSFSALSSRERDEVAMVNTDIERLEKYAQYLTSDIAKLNEHTTNFKEKRVTSISQSGVTTLSSNTDSTVPYLVALHADPSVSKVCFLSLNAFVFRVSTQSYFVSHYFGSTPYLFYYNDNPLFCY